MGRGKGIDARNILLGKARLNINSAPDVSQFFTYVLICRSCRNKSSLCPCVSKDFERIENQIPYTLLNHIYQVYETNKVVANLRPKITIPSGIQLAYSEKEKYYPSVPDREIPEDYRKQMPTTKRSVKTDKYKFDFFIPYYYEPQNLVEPRTLLTWRTGDHKKSVYVDELDLELIGFYDYWKEFCKHTEVTANLFDARR